MRGENSQEFVDDFRDYLNKQNENALSSLGEYKEDIGFIAQIYDLYIKTLESHSSEQSPSDISSHFEVTVLLLFRFAICRLLDSVSHLSRHHVHDSLHARRNAIDAAFVAYDLGQNPKNINFFLFPNKGGYKKEEIKIVDRFRNIKKRLQEERRAGKHEMPLGVHLDKLIAEHGDASALSGHADMVGIIMHQMFNENRIERLPSGVAVDRFSCFIKADRETSQKLYAGIGITFFHIHEVFYMWFCQRTVFSGEYLRDKFQLEKHIESIRLKYYN